jgi:hypothetical protein
MIVKVLFAPDVGEHRPFAAFDDDLRTFAQSIW